MYESTILLTLLINKINAITKNISNAGWLLNDYKFNYIFNNIFNSFLAKFTVKTYYLIVNCNQSVEKLKFNRCTKVKYCFNEIKKRNNEKKTLLNFILLAYMFQFKLFKLCLQFSFLRQTYTTYNTPN